MVNYVYRLEDVERNHERYFSEHAVVASRAVEKLARKSPLAALAAVRDSAARMRVRDDETAAERAVSWANLTGDERALVIDWTFGH